MEVENEMDQLKFHQTRCHLIAGPIARWDRTVEAVAFSAQDPDVGG